MIVSAVRTPIGTFRGGLASVSATKLGATAIKACLERASKRKGWFEKGFFDEMIFQMFLLIVYKKCIWAM